MMVVSAESQPSHFCGLKCQRDALAEGLAVGVYNIYLLRYRIKDVQVLIRFRNDGYRPFPIN